MCTLNRMQPRTTVLRTVHATCVMGWVQVPASRVPVPVMGESRTKKISLLLGLLCSALPAFFLPKKGRKQKTYYVIILCYVLL